MDEQDDTKPAVAIADADSDAGADDANGDDQIGVPVHSSRQEELAEPPPSPEGTNSNKVCKTEEGFDMGYKLEEDSEREEEEDKEKDAGVGTSTGSSKGYKIDETTPVWVKRKRTTRTQVSSDENTAADSLVFMKVCRTDPPPPGNETDQESYAESSGEEENEDEDAKFDGLQQASSSQIVLYKPPSSSRHVFECSTCNKVFSSHQALGGHRASHKRVKGCFASKLASSTGSPFRPTEAGNVNPRAVATDLETPARVRRRNTGERLHECTICLRQFSSGQALGGHKRCHWMSPSARETAVTSSLSAPPLVRNHLSVNHPSPAPTSPPARTGQSAETREVQTPPATMTPASSTSSMHNVPSGSGSGGANVNLSNLPCMDGVGSDWLHLHVGEDPVEPSNDNNGES